MLRARVLGVLGGLLLAACSDRASSPPEPPKDAPSAPEQLAPTPPSHVPGLPATGQRDADGNRLDDVLDEQLLAAGSDAHLLAASVKLQVILNAPLEQGDLDDFVAAGGKVDYVFRELRYGFIGQIPLGRLKGIAAHLGERLHLLAAPSKIVPFMDEATRTGRIRGIWAPGFAGNASGYSGNSNITVAVIDTGVDESHTDLNGRKQSWTDYSGDPAGAVRDVVGHGTHVASIAVGSGAAFGLGGGALPFTQSGTLAGVPSGSYLVATVHTPGYLDGVTALSASASAKFLGGGSAALQMLQGPDPNLISGVGVTSFGSKLGGSPLALALSAAPAAGNQGLIYQGALTQAGGATNFAVASSIADYPAVGDGFNALRGVAPSCKWLGAKVFTDAGSGTSLAIEAAVDDVASSRLTNGVKVMNLSLGIPGGGIDTALRTTVNNAVDDGIVVVVSAGNDGPSTNIGDPARASKVITVGASNDVNELTSYTSAGFSTLEADTDVKPDVLAPGGSAFRSAIMAADSNTADGELKTFPDLVANDYAPMQGTSMAAPFVSGSIALMIDALQQSGTTWTFSSSAQPLLLKMLLSASATELNLAREQGSGNDPSLGRAAASKDLAEGYGIVNPDAAIEALVQSFVSPLTGSVSNTAPARLEWERRAWGRKLSLVNGATVILNLDVPSSADYDLYLYSGTPNANGTGNPVLRASSTQAGKGTDETISYVSTATETAYLFVKRVSGFGAFSCTGSAVSHCGDGDLDTGEQCDPAIAGSATCCTSTCAIVSNGTACSDGNACTTADSCQSGSCSGTAVVCGALDQCHAVGSCDPATGACSNPKQADGTTCDDKNKCTQTDTCVSGACTGSNPVACASPDQCHSAAGSCDSATGSCTYPKKADNTACDDGNACTKVDTCQSGACTGSSPVTCAASDQCHSAGSCDAASGSCSNPAKVNGTKCDDGSKCTATDSCQSGVCTGASPVVCATPDQCHDAGVCDAATGVCSNPSKPPGSKCDDGNACTQADACNGGKCAGTAVVCAAADQCHTAGSCDLGSGLCSSPSKADGTKCDDGNKCTQADSCISGACTGQSPVICAALDQCHDVGVCDGASGACSNPAKSDGAPCSDGNFCTQVDACSSGTCVPGAVVSCAAVDQCHVAGVCDPGSGQCSSPSSADGTSCDDADGCTLGDACESGVCTSTSQLACPPPDECHEAGSCESPAGTCSYATKPDGTVCGARGACEGGGCVEQSQGSGGEPGSAGATNEAGAPGASGTGAASGGSAGTASGGAAGSIASAGEGNVMASAGGDANLGSSAAGEPAIEPNAGAAPLPASLAQSRDASSCGCAVPGAPRRGRYGLWLLAGVAFVVQRRWRRAARLKAECCRASSAGCGRACS